MTATASKEIPTHLINRDHKRLRKVTTPEGVDLNILLGTKGDRVSAIIIDFIIIAIVGIVSGLVIMFIAGIMGISFGTVAFIVTYFFLRCFYFIFFELKWQGQTPGKRYMGLRVIKRAGGRLESSAIFARNLMREVEIYLPLSLIMASNAMGFNGWTILLIWVWCGIMMFMPFFNKDNLRAGDIVGGTWVVSIPKTSLAKEVGTHIQTKEHNTVRPKAQLTFSREQLSTYGIYELQTLENILRGDKEILHKSVAEKIQRKIGWNNDHYYGKPKEFLQEFYSAMRRHHENEILMGRRKESKHSVQR